MGLVKVFVPAGDINFRVRMPGKASIAKACLLPLFVRPGIILPKKDGCTLAFPEARHGGEALVAVQAEDEA